MPPPDVLRPLSRLQDAQPPVQAPAAHLVGSSQRRQESKIPGRKGTNYTTDLPPRPGAYPWVSKPHLAHLKKWVCVPAPRTWTGFKTKGRRPGLQLPSQEVLWVAAVIMLSSAFAVRPPTTEEALEALLGLVQLAVGGADEHSCSVRSLHSLVLVFTQSHP